VPQYGVVEKAGQSKQSEFLQGQFPSRHQCKSHAGALSKDHHDVRSCHQGDFACHQGICCQQGADRRGGTQGACRKGGRVHGRGESQVSCFERDRQDKGCGQGNDEIAKGDYKNFQGRAGRYKGGKRTSGHGTVD
jgi:hypothetical protein